MFRFLRYRFLLIRYTILFLFTIIMLKLTTIFYHDLQQQTIDSTSLVLPHEEKHSSRSLQSTTTQPVNLSTSMTINRTAIDYHREYVQNKNRQQYMHNRHLFSSESTRYVLLVQVHIRIVYLKKFIETLSAVETINQTLLIFSHDFIDPQINLLIANIAFVPVIQIFYPFSQQLYPNEFPGLDPNDCPPNYTKVKALASGCQNAPYPDRYGHYREASIVQIKHHWWWKLNFVFNSIESLRNRSDLLVLLLEEDFYLSPDALVFLRKMENEKERLCPECVFYTLGNLDKPRNQLEKMGTKISIAYWHARYNLGMTISHSFWKSLVKYAEEFCNVDDYNWDWSLVYLAQQRFNFPRVMCSSASRVMHLGSCGIHHKKTCKSESDTVPWDEAEKFFQKNRPYLFPSAPLSLHLKYETKRLVKQLNGGWSDLRDRQLCLSFALKNSQNVSKINLSN